MIRRLKLALHVLRGRPLAYRLTVRGSIETRTGSGLWVDSCTLTGEDRGVRVEQGDANVVDGGEIGYRREYDVPGAGQIGCG